MHVADDRLDALTGHLYDAALDETLWARLAPRIAACFQSPSATVSIQNRRLGSVRRLTQTANYTIDLIEAHRAHFHKCDVWAEGARTRALSTVFMSSELIPDAEFEGTEFFQDFARKLGIFYVVGSVSLIAGDDLCVFGIHRPRSGEEYDEEDKARVARLLPHLERALQTRVRLHDAGIERQAALDALERSATGTLVVSREGRILYANRLAEALLSQADAVCTFGGRLATADRPATERLTQLIRGAVDTAAGSGGSAGGAVVVRRSDRLPLTLLVAPFRPAHDGFGAPVPAAILFIRDPEQATPARIALQELFGLTAAEASLAAALAHGKSLDEIATGQGITLNTARSYLKSVLAKTGTNRQAQLVALILGSVAALVE